jgi:hypothetical protein
VSVVKHPFPIDGTPISFDRETLTKDLFAVVEFSGSQFKVTVVSEDTQFSLFLLNGPYFRMTLLWLTGFQISKLMI